MSEMTHEEIVALADYIGQQSGQSYEQEAPYLTVVRREPVGVAALIAPWNAPLALATMEMAGALAFGNCCILKPSELTPLEFVPLMNIMAEAALAPKGQRHQASHIKSRAGRRQRGDKPQSLIAVRARIRLP